MVNCTLCGKSFKNPQGLFGHMAFHHGVRKDAQGSELRKLVSDKQYSGASTEPTGSAAEGRLQLIERVLGITEGAWRLSHPTGSARKSCHAASARPA